MKTYRLWLWSRISQKWVPSGQTPHTFDTLEDANTEMVKRIFHYGLRYKIVESEEHQS